MKRGWKAIGNIISQKCKDAGNAVTSKVSEWDTAFDNKLAKAEAKVCAKDIQEKKDLDDLVSSLVSSNRKSDVQELLANLKTN